MEPCKVCGAVARYILDNGDVVCTAHVSDERMNQPTGCKVFSATRSRERESLGERVTEWVRVNNVEVTQAFVTQSSDNAFHCITCTIFYRERSGA